MGRSSTDSYPQFVSAEKKSIREHGRLCPMRLNPSVSCANEHRRPDRADNRTPDPGVSQYVSTWFSECSRMPRLMALRVQALLELQRAIQTDHESIANGRTLEPPTKAPERGPWRTRASLFLPMKYVKIQDCSDISRNGIWVCTPPISNQ